MWVISATAVICPRDINHLNELEDEDIPLSSLSGKKMMGSFLFVDIIDISNTTDHPLDDQSRAIWQAYRDDMDKQGYSEAHVVLAKFSYWNKTLLMVPFAVSRKDLAFYGIGGLENPRMLKCVRVVCPVVDNDSDHLVCGMTCLNSMSQSIEKPWQKLIRKNGHAFWETMIRNI